jgi:glycosyltransferase involved in cell wall biosynthesis
MRRPMRILMLAQSYAPVVGGEERIVEDLSAELFRRGHEVAVATLSQPAGEPPQCEDGVRIHLLGSALERIPGMGGDAERRYAPPAPDPLTVRDLRRVLREERPDVVHAHNWLVDSYLPLERRSGAALVLTLHDYGLLCATKRLFLDGEVCSGPAARKCLAHSVAHYGAARGPAIALGTRLAEQRLRRRVDMFVSISAAVGELNRIGAGEPHRVVPNFTGALPAPPAADDPRLAELPDEPFVLFFGDASEDKGARHLVETYAGLDGAAPLVLIGRRLDEAASTGAIALGPMPHGHVIEALRRCLFAVVPSIWAEPFGIVALETAAAGKAIVASDIGGLVDIVADGETGLLVPPGDRAALAGALRRLLDDAGLRERMGEAAARRARELFSPDVIVPQFEAAYEEAIAARLKRGRRGGR